MLLGNFIFPEHPFAKKILKLYKWVEWRIVYGNFINQYKIDMIFKISSIIN